MVCPSSNIDEVEIFHVIDKGRNVDARWLRSNVWWNVWPTNNTAPAVQLPLRYEGANESMSEI
jgi:hypothetical protein